MNRPTLLSPWYAVQKLIDPEVDGYLPDGAPDLYTIEYYTAMEADLGVTFHRDPKKAMLFMNLQSAARVAHAEGAEVRVLYDEAGAKEFDR